MGEVGADGLKMREVGRQANLPIASVYHYFPSAPALIRMLVERMLDELRAILGQGVVRAEGAGPGEAEYALVAIIDAAGDFMGSRPTLPAVLGAMRGAGTARPRSRRHGGQCSNPRPRHRRSPPARAVGGCEGPRARHHRERLERASTRV